MGLASTGLGCAGCVGRLFGLCHLQFRRVVIPSFMRRHFAASQALRLRPLVGATRANTSGPERVPNGSARWHAFPSVLRTWAPVAGWAIDLGFVFHSGIRFIFLPRSRSISQTQALLRRLKCATGSLSVLVVRPNVGVRNLESIGFNKLQASYFGSHRINKLPWSHPYEFSQ